MEVRRIAIRSLQRKVDYRKDDVELAKVQGELRALEWGLDRIDQFRLEESQMFQVK